jgi:hypothetical protein
MNGRLRLPPGRVSLHVETLDRDLAARPMNAEVEHGTDEPRRVEIRIESTSDTTNLLERAFLV